MSQKLLFLLSICNFVHRSSLWMFTLGWNNTVTRSYLVVSSEFWIQDAVFSKWMGSCTLSLVICIWSGEVVKLCFSFFFVQFFFLERSNCVSAVQGSSRYFGLSVIYFLRDPLLRFLENPTQIQYMYIHIDTCIY